MGKAIIAIRVRRISLRLSAILIQLDHHATQTGLTRFLDAVAIQVHPYVVAQTCVTPDTGIDRAVVLAWLQCHREGITQPVWIAIRIKGWAIGHTAVIQPPRIAICQRRQRKVHRIDITRLQLRKGIQTRAVCSGSGA